MVRWLYFVMDMKHFKNKLSIIAMCICGLSAVVYGMMKKEDIVFLLGLIIVIVAYLLIRKKLKEAVHDRS